MMRRWVAALFFSHRQHCLFIRSGDGQASIGASSLMPRQSSAEEHCYAVYDCFSSKCFGGNPGGIVFAAGDLDDIAMLAIAREINAPVTGFVTQISDDGRKVSMRFFMPTSEIAMCGHVTVGLFSHLSTDRPTGTDHYTLTAKAGDIAVTATIPESGPARVMMALSPPEYVAVRPDRSDLENALNLRALALSAVPPPSVLDSGLCHLFVCLDDPEAVIRLTPDFAALAALSRALEVHTIACFAMLPEENGEARLVIRDFCPALGVDETPASGTTNAALSGYLLESGLIRSRSQRILASQGKEIGRPSNILTEIAVEANRITHLQVGGNAVRCLSGTVTQLHATD